MNTLIHTAENAATPPGDLLCLSHLRWNFVYQRPQHLMTRFQQHVRVHFLEEPFFTDDPTPTLTVSEQPSGVRVLIPHLPHGTDSAPALAKLLDAYLADNGISDFIAWYYTPMALSFSDHLTPAVTVYDCMDELSAFHGAPPELISEEARLFDRADLVFTGGRSLFQAKEGRHPNVHLFASSIEGEHFAAARAPQEDPADQRDIPHPRVGFYGVIDERLDRDLLAQAADLRPDLHFVLLGPVVKVRHEDLPQRPNIHYLGMKSYGELPQYLAGWDVAMLPFALNASTQFISPTKTPEYLAAGKPVVSTPIRDVVTPYGDMGHVQIGSTPREFVSGIEACLNKDSQWLEEVDRFLSLNSWDATFLAMWQEIQATHQTKQTDGTNKAEGVHV